MIFKPNNPLHVYEVVTRFAYILFFSNPTCRILLDMLLLLLLLNTLCYIYLRSIYTYVYKLLLYLLIYIILVFITFLHLLTYIVFMYCLLFLYTFCHIFIHFCVFLIKSSITKNNFIVDCKIRFSLLLCFIHSHIICQNSSVSDIKQIISSPLMWLQSYPKSIFYA